VVVISQHVQFVDKGEWAKQRDAASAMLEDWGQSLEMPMPTRSCRTTPRIPLGPGRKPEHLVRPPAEEPERRALYQCQTARCQPVPLSRHTEDMIVSTFTQESAVGKSKNAIRKRQYWVREGSQWKIIYEGNA
jgi:anti-sigma factor ChrR (cupin superfamily)